MIEELDSEYVRVARSKGVDERSVVLKHALRTDFTDRHRRRSVVGAVGERRIGRRTVSDRRHRRLDDDRDPRREFAVIQAVVLVTGAAIIVLNFMIDLAYSWLNPQIRLGAMT